MFLCYWWLVVLSRFFFHIFLYVCALLNDALNLALQNKLVFEVFIFMIMNDFS
jgi:hypothetical protein